MRYQFDGQARVITLGAGITSFNTQDLYSRYKEWVLDGNAGWIVAMQPIGGQPIGSGQTISSYIEMMNGWKIKPFEGHHVLTVLGNIITDDSSNPFISTIGDYNVSIKNQITSNSITVNTGNSGGGSSYTLDEISRAVWDYNLANHNTTGSVGNYIRNKLLTFRDWFTLKEK